MSKTKFKITLNGKVFTRSSEREYTHVLVGRIPEKRARADAYGWTADEEKWMQKDFIFRQQVADGSWWERNGWGQYNPSDANDLQTYFFAKKIVDAGIDAHREAEKQEKIENFHKSLERGDYQFQVISWHQGAKNASSALRTKANRGFYVDLEVFEVGSDVKVSEGIDI